MGYRTKTATTIMEALNKVFLAINLVVKDNGTAFKSKVLRKMLDK